GLLEDGDDLTVGVTGRLHAELSKIIFRKFYSFQRLFAGGITTHITDVITAHYACPAWKTAVSTPYRWTQAIRT
ncbi:hypothetical protein, partial [Undibacterium sp. Xuan67W]|uniref:hypothetical protein n=1 Tax=Undibacterium sp. Xuan67W TaxID=3413057 RepID=UPI003BF28BFB